MKYILLVVILLLTLIRENIFLEINAIQQGLEVNRAYFYLFHDFFLGYTSSELNVIKVILTLLFSLVISLASYHIISTSFQNVLFNKITKYFYVFIFGFILLGSVVAKIVGIFPDTYFVFRKLLGFIQSPLPLFFLYSVFIYMNKK